MSFFQYIPKGATSGKLPSKPVAKKPSAGSFVSHPAPSLPPKPRSIASRRVQSSGSTKSTTTGTLAKLDVEGTDIIYIDEQIKSRLGAKLSTLPELQKDLSDLLWIADNSPDPVDKINAKSERDILRRRIQDVESGFELALYIFRTSRMLEEFRGLSAQTQITSFVRVTNDNTAANYTTTARKNQIILDYLRIAKEYVEISNFRQRTRRTLCEACHSANLEVSEEDGASLICKVCSNKNEVLDDAPTFKDSERVNMSSRYTYTCKGHFIDAMNRLEGKQNITIDPEILDVLRRELELHNLTPLTATKDHIYMFMSERKLSDFYADINLIFFLICGVNPPDITAYRDELLEMLEQLEEAYVVVKDNDRFNSLNVNWKLYKLLQLVDYPCKKDDFFCLKTPTKQTEHETKWYDMIEYLRGVYPDALTSRRKKRWRHVLTI